MTTEPRLPATLWDRRAAIAPFALAGGIAVIAGGVLAAAIAAPAPTRHGVWAVAYLVLVVGVCQLALGVGQALLAKASPPTRQTVATATLYNVANVAVLAGVIAGQTFLLDGGAVLLVAALGLLLYGVRGSDQRGWALYGYRAIVTVLAVCIPIGLFLTTVGPS